MSESAHNQNYKALYPNAIEDIYEAEDTAYAGKEFRDRAAFRRGVGNLIADEVSVEKTPEQVYKDKYDAFKTDGEPASFVAFRQAMAMRDHMETEPRIVQAAGDQYMRAHKHDTEASRREAEVTRRYEQFRQGDVEKTMFVPAGVVARALKEANVDVAKAQSSVAQGLQFHGAAKKNK